MKWQKQRQTRHIRVLDLAKWMCRDGRAKHQQRNTQPNGVNRAISSASKPASKQATKTDEKDEKRFFLIL